MKSKTEYLKFCTKKKIEFIRITEDVGRVVHESGIKEGFALVNPMHITAAVIVNDDEPGLIQDFIDNLERLVPYKGKYRHNTGEDNAAAHIWRQLMAHQVVLPVTKGELDFGPWNRYSIANSTA